MERPRPTFGIMAEWLRRQTRNLVGSALVGSNPADVEALLLFAFILYILGARAWGPTRVREAFKCRASIVQG